MLDFGFAELLFIMAIAVLVMGPKEIPVIMRAIGRVVRRLQYIRYAMTQYFDDVMQDADLKDIQKQVNFEAARRESGFNEEAEDEAYFEEEDEPDRTTP